MSIIAPITGGQLNLMRADGYASRFRLAFPASNIVFQALVNQSFSSKDKIAQLTFDTVTTGAYTDIIPGMTVWIGTSAGALDVGIARVRKTPTSTVLYIGECSEINFSDDLFITVVDDFSIWPRHLKITSSVVYMDYDVAYSNQHTVMLPIVNMGPDSVLELTGAEVTLFRDAGTSQTPGSSISTAVFSCATASSVVGSGLTAVIHFDITGTHLLKCVVTAANGAVATGYRKVVVWDADHPPVTEFEITDCKGSFTNGDWSFTVTMRGQADISSIHDRARVILFAEDIYASNSIQSIGQILDNENHVVSGWVVGESIDFDTESGTVSFSVSGPSAFLKGEMGYAIGLQSKTGTATAWTNMVSLTVDKMLWQFLVWRSTLSACTDCYLTGDTRTASGLSAPVGSIWQQIQAIAGQSILAGAGCDRFNRFFSQINSQYLSDRSDVVTLMSVTKQDYRDSLKVMRSTMPKVSRVDLSGISFITTASAFFSLAPGHVYKRFGTPETLDRLLLTDQSSSNTLAGLIIGQRNNEYPTFDFTIAQNNRMIDVFPLQYLDISVDAEDSPRGIAFEMNIIPREIKYDFSSGELMVSLACEGETFADLNVTGDFPPPATPPVRPPIIFPSIPLPPPFPVPPVPTPAVPAVYLLTVSYGVYYTENFGDATPNYFSKNTGGPSDVGTLVDFDIDKIGGHIYVRAYDTLWTGPLGDDTLSAIIDPTWLRTEFPLIGLVPSDANNVIGCLGVNHLSSNSVLFTAGSGYLGSRSVAVYIGSIAGFSRKVSINWATNDARQPPSNASFYGNQWLATTFAFLDRDAWAKYTASGLGIVAQSYFNSPNYGFWHVRGGNTPNVYLQQGFAGNMVYTPDNLSDLSLVQDLSFSVNVRPACDSTGQFLMAVRNGTLTLEKSSDFGSSWTDITPALPGDIVVTAIACVDENTFIVAGRETGSPPHLPKVYQTTDFGASWTSKVGDLGTSIPDILTGVRKIVVV